MQYQVFCSVPGSEWRSHIIEDAATAVDIARVRAGNSRLPHEIYKLVQTHHVAPPVVSPAEVVEL